MQEASRLKGASSLSLLWLGALFQVSVRAHPRPLGSCCTARKLVNADLLENIMQAWMGWPGFGRQGAEEGEMKCLSVTGLHQQSQTTPECTHCLPSSLLLRHILLGLCTESGIGVRQDLRTEKRHQGNIL